MGGRAKVASEGCKLGQEMMQAPKREEYEKRKVTDVVFGRVVVESLEQYLTASV